LGPKTTELVEVLDKLILILDADGQENWSQWMSQARTWLLDSDFSGIEKVLGAYGGMGFFNDTCLGKVTRTNENFSELQSQAWELATEIKREHEAST
jgi:hypothetical protein